MGQKRGIWYYIEIPVAILDSEMKYGLGRQVEPHNIASYSRDKTLTMIFLGGLAYQESMEQ